jgi:hypothetical protein
MTAKDGRFRFAAPERRSRVRPEGFLTFKEDK